MWPGRPMMGKSPPPPYWWNRRRPPPPPLPPSVSPLGWWNRIPRRPMVGKSQDYTTEDLSRVPPCMPYPKCMDDFCKPFPQCMQG